MFFSPKIQQAFTYCQTPCYVFDQDAVRDRVSYVRSMLPEGTNICYAMKANPFVLESAYRCCEAIEVCSPGEFDICQRLGVPVAKLVISGVNKTEHFIQRVVNESNPVRCITVESENQLALIEASARQANKIIPVLLRLTSGNQFGIDEQTLVMLASKVLHSPNLILKGVQYFPGTQKHSVKRFKRELAALDELLARLSALETDVKLELEYGPGLPIEYCDQEVNNCHEELLMSLADELRSLTFSGPVTLEMGRFLAALCGVYLTRVVDTKCNDGQRYAIIDGGKHQITYYGPSLAFKSPVFSVLQGHENTPAEDWCICGSLCTVGDVLVKQAHIKRLEIGDTLAFHNAGAYCATEGMSLFLSRDLPRIYLIDSQGIPQLVRSSIETSAFNTPLLQQEKSK